MAVINLGRVAPFPRGQYSALTEYNYFDLVIDNGSSYLYINKLPSTGSLLSSTSHWQQIAVKGDKGDKGGIQTAILPNVYLFGDNFDMPNWNDKSDERLAEMSYRSKELNFDAFIKVKPQGTSSMTYPKKNLTIKMYSDDAYLTGKKVEMKEGWGEQSKYCLKADWIDPTHSCNVVSAQIAGRMQAQYGIFPDAPNGGLIDGFPVALYQNGVYQGIYNWNIPKDAWQFGFTKADEDTALIICNEGQTGTSAFLELATEFNGYTWSVEFGNDDADALAALNRVIGFVKDSSDEDFRAHFTEYIDLDAALNYYSFAYLSAAIDNLGKNMLFVTKDRQVWYPSLYDLDSLWGVNWDGKVEIAYNRVCPDEYDCSTSLLWSKLVRCFPNELANRYEELRAGVLSVSNIIEGFSIYIHGIPQREYEAETAMWEGLDEMIRSLGYMREYIYKRAKFVDYKFRLMRTIPTGNYGRKLYELPQTFIGNGTDAYIDTGIRLFDNLDRDWTVIVRFANAIESSEKVILSCFSEIAPNYEGLLVRKRWDSEGNQVSVVTGRNYDLQTRDVESDYSTIAIVKNYNGYRVFRDGVFEYSNPDNRLVLPYMGNLLVGCQDSAEYSKMRFSAVTVTNLVVYRTALGDAEVGGIMNELMG